MNKASFDFDFTLSDPKVQEFAEDLINKGWEVWCVTSRYDYHSNQKYQCDNSDLHKVCDKVGIKPYHRIFTGMNNKIDFLKDHGFNFHLDDDEIEVDLIKKGGMIGILKDDKNNWIKGLTAYVEAVEWANGVISNIKFD